MPKNNKWSIQYGPDSLTMKRGDEEFYARFDNEVAGTTEERRKKLERVANIIKRKTVIKQSIQ